MFTKEANAYLVGKVAKYIWEEEWDKDLFCNGPGMSIFYSKLRALIHKDPKTRPSLSSVFETLTSHPFNFQ
jgi:hypothetical protein